MKKLARITHAGLDIKDRGILTFSICVTYEDGFSQGIGQYALDTWDKTLKRRVGTAYGCEMIRQLLTIFDVNNLHEAIGKDIWVLGDEPSVLAFSPTGIKQLRADGGKTLLFKDIADQFTPIKD